MLYTTTFSQGEVILVSFPFSNQSTLKRRPAVIISSDEYNLQRPDVIIAAITSILHPLWVGDYRLRRWKEAGLVKPSVVKAVLATVDKSIIQRRLGALSQVDLCGLYQNLTKVFNKKLIKKRG